MPYVMPKIGPVSETLCLKKLKMLDYVQNNVHVCIFLQGVQYMYVFLLEIWYLKTRHVI